MYLHPKPSLYGRRISRVVTDNASVASSAFRELAAMHPASFAAVGDARGRMVPFSGFRIRAFMTLAGDAGFDCRTFTRCRPDRDRRLERWVGALPQRTAVFAVNDFTAAEVVAAARASGRGIPSDLMLCGVDNLQEVCEASRPAITSIQLDFEREGYMAAKMACERQSGGGDGKGATAEISPLLAVRRESTSGFRHPSGKILDAVELIRSEACGGLSARDVIACSGMSKSLFNLRFREAMGHSVHDEIEHVRLEKVFTLLSQTDIAVGAIAAMCGYRSNIALHKAFRLRTGISMSEWRSRNRIAKTSY